MPGVKEHSLDSYFRKYADSLTIIETEDGQQKPVFVKSVSWDAEKDLPSFLNQDNKEILGTPVYYHFKAGYYKSKNVWHCLTRRPKNSFTIGLNADNHNLYKFNGENFGKGGLLRLWELDIKTPYSKTLSLSSAGPISDRLFVCETKLFYLTTPIGIRENHLFFLADSSLIQEVQDALKGQTFCGAPCQVTSM